MPVEWAVGELSRLFVDFTLVQVSTKTSVQAASHPKYSKVKVKGRNISWRNASLQKKSGLDYGMQSYDRT